MDLEITLTPMGEGGGAPTSVGPAGWTEFLVGRAEDARLFLHHPTVSRRHCRLLREGHGVVVEDLSSRVGTFAFVERSPSRSWTARLRASTEGERRRTTTAMPASGTRTSSASRHSIATIATTAAGSFTAVCARYITPGPTLKRTASTSEVRRESRSPVRTRSNHDSGRATRWSNTSRLRSRSKRRDAPMSVRRVRKPSSPCTNTAAT